MTLLWVLFGSWILLPLSLCKKEGIEVSENEDYYIIKSGLTERKYFGVAEEVDLEPLRNASAHMKKEKENLRNLLIWNKANQMCSYHSNEDTVSVDSIDEILEDKQLPHATNLMLSHVEDHGGKKEFVVWLNTKSRQCSYSYSQEKISKLQSYSELSSENYKYRDGVEDTAAFARYVYIHFDLKHCLPSSCLYGEF